MNPLAYFGIESSGLSLAVDLLILFVVVLWLSLIYWTYADARRRVADPVMVGCATAASLFPFVGTIIYMVLRPPEYLEDVRERELEMQAAEARLHQLDETLCPHCDYRIERDFIRCPSCLRKLKERCTNCSRPLEQTWTICPYCEADVPSVAQRTRTRRRSGRASSPPVDEELGAESDLPVESDLPDLGTAIAQEDGLGEQEAAPAVAEPTAPRGTGRARRPRPTR